MKKLIFLILLSVLSINLFGFGVVLKNNKLIIGEYVNETKDDIIIKINNDLYNINLDLVSFYIYNDEKIAVGNTKEILDSQKIRYNKINNFITITEKNYEKITQNWNEYKEVEQPDLYIILLKNDNKFVGDLYFVSTDYLYLTHPKMNKIYKIKKDDVIRVKFENNYVTDKVLNRYDGEENLISDEREIVRILAEKQYSSPHSAYSKYRKNLIKKNRLFLSYVITTNHVLSHDKEKISFSATNGVQLSFETLMKKKGKGNAGFGFGASFIPYRMIKMEMAEGEESKPKYGFLPIYVLASVPLEMNSFYSDLTLRGGVDFFFANAYYKSPFNANPLVYFSTSYFVQMSRFLIGLGYQLNLGSLTTSGTTDYILVKDSSLTFSIGTVFE